MGDTRAATTGTDGNLIEKARPKARSSVPAQVREFFEEQFAGFRWPVVVTDWRGDTYRVGGTEEHWCRRPLRVHLKTDLAGRDVLRMDGLRFLERFLDGDIDLQGNLYAIPSISALLGVQMRPTRLLRHLPRAVVFQSLNRARVNVRSHYDLPHEIFDTYLDRAYQSYSCAMFEDPEKLDIAELTRIGRGENDEFDSLEKAQWRKFDDATSFLRPRPGETLLDVGSGYAGQLEVALETHAFGHVVGWTRSHNQTLESTRRLSRFDSARWEVNEGDYRSDDRIFDHITSTGMVSHVGPRGLVPYVRNIRRRIRTGGRYVHHALMKPHTGLPLDLQVGVAFNKRYVWPGFHWFTFGQHVRALERNGFEVERAVGLRRHYAKTTAAWYERMMERETEIRRSLGDPGFRAWQIYLAGSSGSFQEEDIHVYRLYCKAI